MIEIQQLFEYFIRNEGPWAILFVFFFSLEYRSNKKREAVLRENIGQLNQLYSEKLEKISKDTAIMLETWKIIIENELERREKNGTRPDSRERRGTSPGNSGASTTFQNADQE
jgi:hypothetical protein